MIPRTPQDLQAWVSREPDPIHRWGKRIFLEASTCAGNGTEEEQLIRLMVWCGARLRTQPHHSKIMTPLDILREGSAWCDQHTKVFGFLTLHLYGLDAREIALKHSDGVSGHTVVEVQDRTSTRWRLFDPHTEHQAIYRDPEDGHIMSCEELLTQPSAVVDEAHWWRGQNGVGKEGFYTGEFPPRYFRQFSADSAYKLPAWQQH